MLDLERLWFDLKIVSPDLDSGKKRMLGSERNFWNRSFFCYSGGGAVALGNRPPRRSFEEDEDSSSFSSFSRIRFGIWERASLSKKPRERSERKNEGKKPNSFIYRPLWTFFFNGPGLFLFELLLFSQPLDLMI